MTIASLVNHGVRLAKRPWHAHAHNWSFTSEPVQSRQRGVLVDAGAFATRDAGG
jgi:hypothetical protein